MKILSLLWLAAAVCSAAAEKPLNILVLYADDWRYDTLGCAGNPVVKTPQLDQLTPQIAVVTRFCVNRNPSRASWSRCGVLTTGLPAQPSVL